MLFLIDVDGVLCDFTGGCLSVLKSERILGNITQESFTQYDFWETLSPKQGEMLSRAINRKGFVATLNPLPQAKEAVARIRAQGHHVKFVTAPLDSSEFWMFERKEWLKFHFGAKKEDIIFAHDKSVVWGNVFIDDKDTSVLAWQKQWPTQKGFIFSQPWSKEQPGIARVDWDFFTPELLIQTGDKHA